MGKDPIAVLISRIAGLEATRKRGRTAMQMWSTHNFSTIKQEFEEQLDTTRIGRKGRISEFGKFTNERWATLSTEEKAQWQACAEQDAKDVAQAKEDSKRPLARLSPEDTQVYVPRLAMFGMLIDL